MVVLGRAVFAQNDLRQGPSGQRNCKDVQGNLVEVFIPAINRAVGTLTNAGWLNGASEGVSTSGSFPTPDANKVSFSFAYTITTGHGQLKARNRFLFDLVTGLGAAIWDIDGTASAGIFAGATGVIFQNQFESVTIEVGPYKSLIVARVCFAPGHEPRDR